jgi:hypothetical protein
MILSTRVIGNVLIPSDLENLKGIVVGMILLKFWKGRKQGFMLEVCIVEGSKRAPDP